MALNDDIKITSISLSLPFQIGKIEWKPNPIQRKASWSLYVELVTRVTVEPIDTQQGYLREALNSLYSLFQTTREILKEAGPEAGISEDSIGGIAVKVLNRGLRPFLTKWHPLLNAWEEERERNISPLQHEKNWTETPKLRKELDSLSNELSEYASALAMMSGVTE